MEAKYKRYKKSAFIKQLVDTDYFSETIKAIRRAKKKKRQRPTKDTSQA